MQSNRITAHLLGSVTVVAIFVVQGCGMGEYTALSRGGDVMAGRVVDRMVDTAVAHEMRKEEARAGRTQVHVHTGSASRQQSVVGQTSHVNQHRMDDGSIYTGGLIVTRADGYRAPHGRGVNTWPTGHRYDGDYRDGRYEGRGVFTWPCGARYDGEFRSNARDGRGVHIWPDGRRYEGDFRNDVRNGRGTMSWPDGRRYVGEWKDGKMSGAGRMTHPDGRVEEGRWLAGEFLGEARIEDVSPTTDQEDAKSGTLNIQGEESEAEIFIDDEFVGNLPARLNLAEGTHTITIKRAGFKDFIRTVRVIADSELTLRPVWEKEEELQ